MRGNYLGNYHWKLSAIILSREKCEIYIGILAYPKISKGSVPLRGAGCFSILEE